MVGLRPGGRADVRHLPGLCCWQLVLTLLDEDDKRDQVVGQVLINLMQENLWKSGGVFTTKLREVKVRD